MPTMRSSTMEIQTQTLSLNLTKKNRSLYQSLNTKRGSDRRNSEPLFVLLHHAIQSWIQDELYTFLLLHHIKPTIPFRQGEFMRNKFFTVDFPLFHQF